ncbi:MAG: acyl-CoA dehydrogenase family protein [Gemmatimonadota bacterium]|nr:MAG: acyl-CoA dehydrogenase family protein [Gemmatimonadota bacterium]
MTRTPENPATEERVIEGVSPVAPGDVPLTAEEYELLRSTVRRIAQDKAAPLAAEIDRTGEFPWSTIQSLGKEGLLSLMLPEDCGGMNGDLVGLCIATEELAKVCASTALTGLAHAVGLMPMMIASNEEQQKRFYSRVTDDNCLTSFALTEPGAGSDAAALTTKAELRGDHYVLNGRKCFITNGSVAALHSVFVRTAPGAGHKAISCLVVEDGTEGVIVGKKEDKLGIRGSDTTELVFENAKVPRENLLGREGEGWRLAMSTLNLSRPAIGAMAVGIAQGALDVAIGYAKDRVQFGRPIADFQGVQFMLAEMATQIEAARSLVYRTAGLLNENKIEAAGKSLATEGRLSAMAKCFASDVAMMVTTDAVQVLGGYGYLKDFPVERMMRDAKITQIFEGTNQIQRLVIARSLLH